MGFARRRVGFKALLFRLPAEPSLLALAAVFLVPGELPIRSNRVADQPGHDFDNRRIGHTLTNQSADHRSGLRGTFITPFA
jgi:hypothetical protein